MKTKAVIENGFKETEIGLVPEDWEVVRLGNYIDNRKGKKPHSLTEHFEDGFLPYLTAGYFRTGNAKQFVNIGKEKDSIIINEGDIVLIWDGSNAGDVFTGLKGVLASTMVRINPKNRLIKKHLFYFLKTKFDVLNEKTTGSTIPHVSKSIFENLLLPLPLLSEQQKIAFVLSKIQQIIEQQDRIIETTRELKKSLMNKLFTEGLHGEEQKETEIGLMPKSWKSESISNVVEKTKQIDPRKTPNLSFKYIDVSGVSNEFYKIIEYRAYNGSNAPSRAKKLIQTNDVIFATVRPTLKRIAYVDEDYDGKICSTAFCVLRIKKNVLSSRYLYYCVQNDEFIEELAKLQRGASYPAITDGDIKRQQIPLPKVEEQKEIANILFNIDKKLAQVESRKQTFQALFKTVLNQLMTGKVRVKDFDFEVN